MNSKLFLFPFLFQPFSDDYVATSFGSDGRVPRPKEVSHSEAGRPVLSGGTNAESIIVESLRKEIKVLKAQCLAAVAQTKKLSDREEASLKRAAKSDEVAGAATAKLTQAIERETYLLELITSSSQELIGEFLVAVPEPNFPLIFLGSLKFFIDRL